MHTHNILETIDISKRLGELQALDNVSLKLRSGSFHALLGENDAGKSTPVKGIMGYYQPDEGEVLFRDRQQAITNPHDAMRSVSAWPNIETAHD